MNPKDYLHLIALHPWNFLGINRELKRLMKTEYSSRATLDEIQLTKLRIVLQRAASETVYWNNRISDCIDPDAANNIECIQHLPVLNKKTIRDNGDGMWSNAESKFIVATTGGTTGFPLTIRRDSKCDCVTKAALWRGRISWGATPSARSVLLHSFGKASLLGTIRMRLGNVKIGDAFPSSQEQSLEQSRMIEKFRPASVEGFATGLLSSINASKGTSRVKVPAVISTGEMLYPHQRRQIEEYYSGKVYTYYGCNEVGAIAFECENQNLHVCEEHVIVETVDENGLPVKNEPGRVLVTDLDNTAMPFIRYELGDIATLSTDPCKCGRNSLVISELVGRSQDFLSSSNGKVLQATQLAGSLKDLTLTGALQFVQESEDSIAILHEKNGSGSEAELNLIKKHLHDRLGQLVSVQTRHVASIERTNRGKKPLVVRAK